MKQLIKKYWKYSSLFFVFLLGLVPLVWFWKRAGVLITGSDTNFPLNPEVWFVRRFSVWQSVSNGGGNFSSSTAGTFFHLLQFIPFKLGLPLQAVEISNLIFWFMLICLSAFLLARTIFPEKKLSQVIFVLLYSIMNISPGVITSNAFTELDSLIPIVFSFIINAVTFIS